MWLSLSGLTDDVPRLGDRAGAGRRRPGRWVCGRAVLNSVGRHPARPDGCPALRHALSALWLYPAQAPSVASVVAPPAE